MTTLDRGIVRLSSFVRRGRYVVVRLEAGGKLIRFRLKGTRTWHTATVEQCFWLAVKNTAEDERAERKRRHEERKKLRGAL